MPKVCAPFRTSGLLVCLSALWACGRSAVDVEATGVAQHALPAPVLDIPSPSDGHYRKLVLAGGCFWTVEAVFEAVNGVVDVVSGYTGGTAETARYDLVAWAGTTDHAEAVEVTYDPNMVSFGQLLRVFFSVAHDPTELNYQGPDKGRQYRSDIFYVDDEQRAVAQAYIDQLDTSGELSSPIVTRLDPLGTFYWAEDEHQDFVLKHPDDVYVLLNTIPKLLKFGAVLPDLYRPPWGIRF